MVCFSLGRMVEVALTALMVVLLGYQVNMPSNDNSRYTFVVHNGQIVRMDTRDGVFEQCDQHLKCTPVKTDK